MAATSPTPRRVSTPSWLDLRLVLGVVLVLAAVFAGAVIVSRADHTHGIVVARQDLAAGTVLTSGELTVSRVRLPSDGSGVYLDDVSDAVGKTLNRPVSRNELLPARALGSGSQRTRVDLPLGADAAPDLRAGERLEVWVSSPSCSSVVVLPAVTVQDVRTDSDATIGSDAAAQDVAIEVSPSDARRVFTALNIDQAQIHAGILLDSGGAAPSGAPQDTARGDLASCATRGR